MLTNNGKIKIFFADPDHNSEFTNTSNESRLRPVPFGIARIAAYSKKKFPQIEFKLFKNMKKMLEDLKNEEPNILAISHYFWNTKLSHRIARFAKELYPNILIVMGGPNLDRKEEAYEEYSKNYPFVDFVVIGEAEFVMNRIIETFVNNNLDIKKTKDNGVSGAFSIIDKGKINFINDNHRTRSLDEFPSPYKTGLLKEFLIEGFSPIIETVRGCPYRCAFCEQGADFFTKLAMASTDYVFDELEYIRKYYKGDWLLIADVNFGITHRDWKIAEWLQKSRKDFGWPNHIYCYNAKMPTEKTFKCIEMLYPMIPIMTSFQSTNEQTLESINRSNIGFDRASAITKWARKKGYSVETELIFGMPKETRASFIKAIDDLIGIGIDNLAMYNLKLLPGSKLHEKSERKRYDFNTMYRHVDDCYGEYEFETKERIFEHEEVVVSTNTISKEDYFFCRTVGMLVESLYSNGLLRPVFKFLISRNILPSIIFTDLATKGNIGKNLKKFLEEYNILVTNELFESPDKIEKAINNKKFWNEIVSKKSDLVKANYAFSSRLKFFETETLKEICDFILISAKEKLSKKDYDFLSQILLHCRLSTPDLNGNAVKDAKFNINAEKWVNSGSPQNIEDFILKAPKRYQYSLDEKVKNNISETLSKLKKDKVKINMLAEQLSYSLSALSVNRLVKEI